MGVTAFLNGLGTLTQGVDLTANYPTDFGDLGSVDWTLAGNYNTTSVSRVAPTPAVFGGSGVSFFTPLSLFNFVHSAPSTKIGLTANWSLDAFGVTLRETYWGPEKQLASPNSQLPYYDFSQAGVVLTDLEARYNITEGLQIAVGANNLFNIRPDGDYFVPSALFGAGALADMVASSFLARCGPRVVQSQWRPLLRPRHVQLLHSGWAGVTLLPFALGVTAYWYFERAPRWSRSCLKARTVCPWFGPSF